MEPLWRLIKARSSARNRCRSFSVQLMTQLATGTRMAVYRVPCKSWNCPKCASKKSNEISKRAGIYFQGSRLRFWTLTVKPQENIPAALLSINQAWNRLRLKITRKVGKVKYIKVLEDQDKTKMPHFHVLVDKYISWHWMQGAAVASGFGLHLWVEPVRSEHVIHYVLKYLRKGMKNDSFLDALLSTNGRRYGFSQGCPPSPSITAYSIVRLVKSRDETAIDVLHNLYLWKMCISTGYYPLSVTSTFAEYFFPNAAPLLPGIAA